MKDIPNILIKFDEIGHYAWLGSVIQMLQHIVLVRNQKNIIISHLHGMKIVKLFNEH